VTSPNGLPSLENGAAVGAGVGVMLSNADHIGQLGGAFDQANLNTPVFSASLAWAKDDHGQVVWTASVVFGPSLGGSLNVYPTTTKTFNGFPKPINCP